MTDKDKAQAARTKGTQNAKLPTHRNSHNRMKAKTRNSSNENKSESDSSFGRLVGEYLNIQHSNYYVPLGMWSRLFLVIPLSLT